MAKRRAKEQAPPVESDLEDAPALENEPDPQAEPPEEDPQPDPDAPDGDAILNEMKKRIEESDTKARELAEENEKLRQQGGQSAQDKNAAQKEAVRANKFAADKAEEAHTAKIADIGKQRQEALAAGDYVREDELNGQLIDLRGELNGIRNYKKQLEAYEANLDKVPPAPAADQPKELYTSATKQWIEAHPQFKTDAQGRPLNKFTRETLNAHDIVTDSTAAGGHGLTADTPQYFAAVEEILRERGQISDEEGAAAPAPAAPRKASPAGSYAAPGAGKSPAGAGKGGGRGKVTLTADQMKAAKISGMTPEAYYEQMKAIESEDTGQP